MITLTKDKYLSDLEVAELMRVLAVLRPKFERDVLLIELALYSGARQGELIKVSKTDLDPHQQTVFIRHPEKDSSPREVPLPKEFFTRLWAYSLTTQDLLFPISDSRVRQIWMDIRPFKKKFHALRHTFGRTVRNRLKRKDKPEPTIKDLETIQYLMGHKSITSTMIYVRENLEAHSIRASLGL